MSPKEGNPVFHIDAGEGIYQISAHGQYIGNDLHLVITGGEQPHVGAVAVGTQALGEPDGIHVSLITVPGHKEDVVVEKAAYSSWLGPWLWTLRPPWRFSSTGRLPS